VRQFTAFSLLLAGALTQAGCPAAPPESECEAAESKCEGNVAHHCAEQAEGPAAGAYLWEEADCGPEQTCFAGEDWAGCTVDAEARCDEGDRRCEGAAPVVCAAIVAGRTSTVLWSLGAPCENGNGCFEGWCAAFEAPCRGTGATCAQGGVAICEGENPYPRFDGPPCSAGNQCIEVAAGALCAGPEKTPCQVGAYLGGCLDDVASVCVPAGGGQGLVGTVTCGVGTRCVAGDTGAQCQ
jgi:hypothetical protein